MAKRRGRRDASPSGIKVATFQSSKILGRQSTKHVWRRRPLFAAPALDGAFARAVQAFLLRMCLEATAAELRFPQEIATFHTL